MMLMKQIISKNVDGVVLKIQRKHRNFLYVTIPKVAGLKPFYSYRKTNLQKLGFKFNKVFLENLDTVWISTFFSTFFSQTVIKSVRISFVGVEVYFYRSEVSIQYELIHKKNADFKRFFFFPISIHFTIFQFNLYLF